METKEKRKRRALKPHFDSLQLDFHKYAAIKLVIWLDGLIEVPLSHEGEVIYTPDISCYNNGVLSCIYAVVDQDHLINVKQLGLIQDYCFRTGTEITVFEVSGPYILSLSEKPPYISTNECFIINHFEVIQK